MSSKTGENVEIIEVKESVSRILIKIHPSQTVGCFKIWGGFSLFFFHLALISNFSFYYLLVILILDFIVYYYMCNILLEPGYRYIYGSKKYIIHSFKLTISKTNLVQDLNACFTFLNKHIEKVGIGNIYRYIRKKFLLFYQDIRQYILNNIRTEITSSDLKIFCVEKRPKIRILMPSKKNSATEKAQHDYLVMGKKNNNSKERLTLFFENEDAILIKDKLNNFLERTLKYNSEI